MRQRLQMWLGVLQARQTPPTADDPLPVNRFRRRVLLIYAMLLLSVPSAMGVQRALAPTRGWAAATLAAIGFELLYLSTSLLLLNGVLQRFARRVALAAVGTAIVLNVLADYTVRVPGGLATWTTAQARFDPLALALSILESAPLAGLAYAGATLLHRLSEADVQLGDVVARLRAEVAQLADHAAQVERERADLAAQLAQLRAAAEREGAALQRQLAQQAEEIAQLRALPPATDLDLAAIAAALRTPRAVSWREIEVLLGRPHSTLRGQVGRRNGAGV